MPDVIAAIDIGTNTVLLTVAELAPGTRRAQPLIERATITRLGRGVDRTRRLGDAEQRLTLNCLREYAGLLESHGVQRFKVAGTSALRDAENGAQFLKQAESVLKRPVEVISGVREAKLSFSGALSGLSVTGPCVVLDVGGGSTELVVGEAAPDRVFDAISLDVGSVRLTERYIRSDPAATAELAAINADVQRALASAPSAPRSATLIGVAGTMTTLAAIELQMIEYASDRVHESRLTRAQVARLAQRLGAMTLAERLILKGLPEKRADVIVAGCLIVHAVLDHYGFENLIVSDRGVRWGLIQELAYTES